MQITPAFFTWLVGPMQTVEATADDGEVQRSGVHIERCRCAATAAHHIVIVPSNPGIQHGIDSLAHKCRYLAESNCVGMCVNLCKAPVQTFFTEELGMPLTMKPNFDDYSCEMVFGLTPPSLEEDEVMQHGCISECTTALGEGAVCHKLR